MSGPPPYTLVHRRDPGECDRADRANLVDWAACSDLAGRIGQARRFDWVDQIVRAKRFDWVTRIDPGVRPEAFAPEAARPTTVGLWDVGARVGFLPAIIAALNAAQAAFRFFQVQAIVPAGLISRPERVRAVASAYNTPIDDAEEIDENVIAGDFFDRADVVRGDLGLDYLAGLTPHLVAYEGQDVFYRNYFSVASGSLILASTYALREYADRAERPFEAAVLGLVIANLLVNVYPALDFHDPDTGCLFDMCRQRSDSVAVLRDPRIEPSCLALIPPEGQAPAQALVAALASYRRPESDRPSAPDPELSP